MTEEATGTNKATSTTDQDLKQELSQHVDSVHDKLDAVKKDIAALHDEDKKTLEQKQGEIRQRLEEQKTKAQEMQSLFKKWRDEKAAPAKEAAR
jgi:regulator of replication initiation timing